MVKKRTTDLPETGEPPGLTDRLQALAALTQWQHQLVQSLLRDVGRPSPTDCLGKKSAGGDKGRRRGPRK